MQPIWAKSKQSRSLVEHTEDVCRAFVALFGCQEQPTSLSEGWRRFFGLVDYELFWRCTEAAIAFHDWGKANDGFQSALLHGHPQEIRHEHLSGLLLGLESMQKWVAQRDDVDWDVVLGAVISHHLKCDEYEETFQHKYGLASKLPRAKRSQFRVLWDEDRCADLWESTRRRLCLDGGTPRLPVSLWSFDGKRGTFDLRRHAEQVWTNRLKLFEKRLRQNPENAARRRLMWAVRSALIVADAVGSAQVRLGKPLETWIRETVIDAAWCSHQEVWDKVITPRLDQLKEAGRWDATKGIQGWSEFQIACEQLSSRALLVAPCGSGKTLAAWRWIAKQCERPIQRVLFLYPTRGTATEGFRDYVAWAPESDAGLMHGTAEFELDGMFDNPTGDELDARAEKRFQVDPRLYALGFWSKRIVSATVDQFLGFMQYQYASLLMLPLLVNSVVVVDEVHSFDRGMFSALTDLLKSFDVPVLCMTASLPKRRREVLQECGLAYSNAKEGELQKTAEAPRYRVEWTTRETVIDQIRTALADGRKVLWVVNQVARTQAAVRELAEDLDSERLQVTVNGHAVPLHCYHSRFRLCDRKYRHEETVAAFRRPREGEPSRPVLAVTSQVCEMSLDLDADLLITELAPITALIQRMGRCNRVPAPRDTAGHVLVYRSENERPYDRDSLIAAETFVNCLCELQEQSAARRVNQEQLEDALEKLGGEVPVPKRCQFLESGPYADGSADSFRELDEFTMSGVLTSDVDEFVRLQSIRSPTDGLVLPVPRRLALTESDPRLPHFLCVVQRELYQRMLGLCDDSRQPRVKK